jgi:magnesium-transporting ATPase (P-type)
MSVICQNSRTKGCELYTKGSPEMMLTIMKPSTIPSNYNETLKEYASHGFRVLAIGSRTIPIESMKTISRQDS